MSEPQRKPRLLGRLLVAVAPVAVAAGVVNADQWYVEPSARLYSFYEDNVGLVPEDEVSSPGLIASGQVTAGQRSEVSDISLAGEVLRRQYFDDSDRNTTDFHFDGGWVRRVERDRFEIDAAYDFDSTLTSEDVTSGRVQQNIRRHRWRIGPAWERQVSERLSVKADAGYESVRYDDDFDVNLVDYSFATVSTGLSYGLSERLRLIGDLDYARYRADDADNRSDSYGLLGGVEYRLTETLTMTALAGARHTESETGQESDDSTGALYRLSAEQRFETGSLRVGLRRTLRPSGTGGFLDTIGGNLAWNQMIVPRWRWALSLDAYRNARPSGDDSADDRDFISVSPRIRHEIDLDWSVELGYRYRYQKYDNAETGATANAVFVTLVYAPKRERPDLDLTR